MTQSFYKSGYVCIGHFRTLFQSCLPFSEAVLKSIFKTQMVPFFEVEKLQVRLNTMMLKGRFLILNLVIVQSPMRVWNWIYLGRRRFWSCQKMEVNTELLQLIAYGVFPLGSEFNRPGLKNGKLNQAERKTN